MFVNCFLDKEVFLLKSCSNFIGACKGRAKICYKMYIGVLAGFECLDGRRLILKFILFH